MTGNKCYVTTVTEVFISHTPFSHTLFSRVTSYCIIDDHLDAKKHKLGGLCLFHTMHESLCEFITITFYARNIYP